MQKIALTGIKPTGIPHVGNYLGMIQPALELVKTYTALYFIADYHALTTVREPRVLNEQTYQVAAAWLALGLDPERVVFFRQSDIPEVFELAWILSCFTSKGLLNRAHAYKAATEANTAAGKTADADINGGLFNYPILMAADILLFGTHIVPVGLDQKQHVEIARDIAESFNHTCGKLLTLPESWIQPEVKTIPGIDGRKMSKNYANTILIFDQPARIRKQIMRIVTDSKRPEESKNPDNCTIFRIYSHFAAPAAIAQTRERYLRGGLAYSEIKTELFELLQATFASATRQYEDIFADHRRIDRILEHGADKARKIAKSNLNRIRKKIGIE